MARVHQAKCTEKIARRKDYHPVDWRQESSIVTAVKRAYAEASLSQRAQLRGWMKRTIKESQ